VFIRLLEDLKAEGWKDKAEKLEGVMRARADHWKTETYPFGSEMPWDSTGQEEVYGWTRYFHYDDKAEVTLNAFWHTIQPFQAGVTTAARDATGFHLRR